MASDRLPAPRILVYLLLWPTVIEVYITCPSSAPPCSSLRPLRCRRPVAPSRRQGQRLYKWTDHNGVVHYGDKIPPEYANLDRNVLNDQGVRVGFEEGEVTEAERAVIDATRGRGRG